MRTHLVIAASKMRKFQRRTSLLSPRGIRKSHLDRIMVIFLNIINCPTAETFLFTIFQRFCVAETPPSRLTNGTRLMANEYSHV